MEAQSEYFRQVQLLVRTLPEIAKESCFALKGGTALNLFVRDLPRLSVDIDLTYLPIEDRASSLEGIETALSRIANSIPKTVSGASVSKTSQYKLVVRQQDIQIKIETSSVLRGAVHPTEIMEVTERTENEFGYAEIQTLSFNDLYAGKMNAALDRQHPRDLFDIRILLGNEGISRDLFKTFLVYLISNNRPIVELLAPRSNDIAGIYESEFERMAATPISLDDLLETREEFIKIVQSSLTDNDKQFLVSFKKREPDWSLLDLAGVEILPAVKWKLHNLGRIRPSSGCWY